MSKIRHASHMLGTNHGMGKSTFLLRSGNHLILSYTCSNMSHNNIIVILTSAYRLTVAELWLGDCFQCEPMEIKDK